VPFLRALEVVYDDTLYKSTFTLLTYFTGAKYCDPRACLPISVCSHILKTTRRNFTKYSVAVTQSTSDNTVICYVHQFLWTTSRFHIMERMGQNQTRRVRFVQFTRWRHRGRSPQSLTAASCLVLWITIPKYQCFVCTARNTPKNSPLIRNGHSTHLNSAVFQDQGVTVKRGKPGV